MYESELQQLIIDLDNLVERKKLQWTDKIKQSEAKLAEERKLHSRTKSIIALKEVETKLLKKVSEDAKSEYEVRIANLKKSTDSMADNLSKLQLKYNKWRSRSAAHKQHALEVRMENALSSDLSKSVQTVPISPPIGLISQLSTKSSEISHSRERLNSIELAFRSQIQKFEGQLNELLCLKRIQDKEIKILKDKQPPRPATRNIRIQWSPCLPSAIKTEVSIQVKPKTQSIYTLTDSKYLGPSESDVIIKNLRDGIIQKDARIRELEDASSVAMDMMETLRSELEENKMLLAQKSSELSQERLRVRLRERRAFTSKACQSELIGCCDREIDAKPVRTQDVECQTESNESLGTVPDFLTEALIGLDSSQRPVSSAAWSESALPNDCRGISCQTVQVEPPSLGKEDTPNAQIEVDVSVDTADVTNEGGTDVNALLANWKSAEDQWINQLGDNLVRSSPVWRIEKDGQFTKDTRSAPVVGVTAVPATTTTVTLSTTDRVYFSPPWNSNEECEGSFDDRIRQFDKHEITIPLPNISTASESVSAQNALNDVSSNFTLISMTAAGDTWDGHNESRSAGGMRGDSSYGLGRWNDDDIEQLAVQFLASEREHSAQLEAAIDRHLEQLRLDVASPCPPLVPSAQ
ncbi:hypothetical protein Aperf_G00000031272 [Anoplocephala perfoliata]